jgi:hypothetical protein
MDDIGSDLQNDQKKGAPQGRPLVVAGRPAGPLDAACGMVAISSLVRGVYNEYPLYFWKNLPQRLSPHAATARMVRAR